MEDVCSACVGKSLKPILFSTPMVKAILLGSKVETRRQRRITKRRLAINPYGEAGDCLWVRETWRPSVADKEQAVFLAADHEAPLAASRPGWKPSIHMPRKFSRIRLMIVSIETQHLQDMREIDATFEGFKSLNDFRALWNEINPAYPWEVNPTVWRILFDARVMTPAGPVPCIDRTIRFDAEGRPL